eukprot:TRINITY_DN32994_c0_g1_i3.p1 TRINITY_DN32994_c0_g1~~TRINITY_DN32994_c0_g1_i3.p1  ORF type:complete len:532 (-),score=59.23 TRINITY_DN32994_c0_g1_i3:314-1696(-)
MELATIVSFALLKLLKSDAGKQLAKESLPYAEAALTDGHPSVRMVGLSVMKVALLDASPQVKQSIIHHLLHCFQDESVSVYKSASESILDLTKEPNGFQQLMQIASDKIKQITDGNDGLITIRGIDFLGQVAAQSHTNAEQVLNSGLLDSLLKALSNSEDPLMQVTSLTLIEEVITNLNQTHFRALCKVFIPPILELVKKYMEGEVDPVTSTSIGVCAKLLRESLEDDEEKQSNEESCKSFLNLMQEILQSYAAGQTSGIDTVINAIGAFGSSYKGSQLLTCHGKQIIHKVLAMSLSGEEGLRICATHALASVFGAERIAPKEDYSNVCLDQESGYDNMEVLHKWLGMPTISVYVAVYRLLEALCVRVWAAELVCMHMALINNILEPSSDFDPKVKNWRFAVILSLVHTLDSLDMGNGNRATDGSRALQNMSGSIRQAAQQGPYGSGTRVVRQHLVATIP